MIKIALVGNPNCGKTVIFNALTGSRQYVGNWPGVTVEKKEGQLKGRSDVIVTDLPGIYSLSPYTMEEVVSRDYLLKEKPDVIINIVDGTNIERNLYLTTQIREIGIPAVMALNMMDLVRKNGDQFDLNKLSKRLGMDIVETCALKGEGIKEVSEKAIMLAMNSKYNESEIRFSEQVESVLQKITNELPDSIEESQKRWYAVKLFERDNKLSNLKLGEQTEKKVAALEAEMDEDSETIITNERYDFIEKIMKETVKKPGKKLSTSDKIDKIVTNRFLGLPIFALVMVLVYWISVSSLGTILTDWANDGLFGDGWFVAGIGREAYDEAVGEFDVTQAKIEGYLNAAEENGYDVEVLLANIEAEEELDEEALNSFVSAAGSFAADIELENEDGEIDEVVSMTLADFTAALNEEEPNPSEYGPWIIGINALATNILESLGASDLVMSLVVDGIIGGLGSVLGFTPQIAILFLLLSILEDCGYMVRIAFVMDRVFRGFGLSGKSFIPLLVSSGCGIPGIMATKTIENDNDRRLTIMTATFVPCGAKLPVIALLGGVIAGGAWWISPSMYFAGIAAVLISAIILKKTKPFAGDPAPFVMELPAYHIPSVKGVLIHVWERLWGFIKKAGTILFLCCVVMWFLSSFGFGENGFGLVGTEESLMASLGGILSFLFAPLGFGNWRAVAASISGFVAKEGIVTTMGVVAGMGEVAETNIHLWANVAEMFPNAIEALSFLLFNLLDSPCLAAISTMGKELNDKKWTAFAIAYQNIFAYSICLIVYQLGCFIAYGAFTVMTLIAFAVLAFMLFMLFRPNPYKKKNIVSKRSVLA